MATCLEDIQADATCGNLNLNVRNHTTALAFVVGVGMYRQPGGPCTKVYRPLVLRPGGTSPLKLGTVQETNSATTTVPYFPKESVKRYARVSLWYVQVLPGQSVDPDEFAGKEADMSNVLDGRVDWTTFQTADLALNLCNGDDQHNTVSGGDHSVVSFHSANFFSELNGGTPALPEESAWAELYFFDATAKVEGSPEPSKLSHCRANRHRDQVFFTLAICVLFLGCVALLWRFLVLKDTHRDYLTPHDWKDLVGEKTQRDLDLQASFGAPGGLADGGMTGKTSATRP